MVLLSRGFPLTVVYCISFASFFFSSVCVQFFWEIAHEEKETIEKRPRKRKRRKEKGILFDLRLNFRMSSRIFCKFALRMKKKKKKMMMMGGISASFFRNLPRSFSRVDLNLLSLSFSLCTRNYPPTSRSAAKQNRPKIYSWWEDNHEIFVQLNSCFFLAYLRIHQSVHSSPDLRYEIWMTELQFYVSM